MKQWCALYVFLYSFEVIYGVRGDIAFFEPINFNEPDTSYRLCK